MPIAFFGAGVWHTNGARGMGKHYLVEFPLSASPLEISSESILLWLADYEPVRAVLADAFGLIEGELIPSLRLFEQCLLGHNLPAFYKYTCLGIYLGNKPPEFLKYDLLFIEDYLAKLDAIEEHAHVFQVSDAARLGKVADFFSGAKAQYSNPQIVAVSGMARAWQALNLYADAMRKAYTGLSSPLAASPAFKTAEAIANAYAARALEYSNMLRASAPQFEHVATSQSKGGVKAAKAKAKTNARRNSEIVAKYFETPEAERHSLAGKLSLLSWDGGPQLTAKAIWKIWSQYGIKQGQSNAELAQRYASYSRYRKLPAVVYRPC